MMPHLAEDFLYFKSTNRLVLSLSIHASLAGETPTGE